MKCSHGFYYDCPNGCPEQDVTALCCPCDWGAACSEHDRLDPPTPEPKKPEMLQVNDELLDHDGTTWQITHVGSNGVVIATPIYHKLHKQMWCRFGYIAAVLMKRDSEAYAKWEGEQAQAEIRAELGIPQHLVW